LTKATRVQRARDDLISIFQRRTPAHGGRSPTGRRDSIVSRRKLAISICEITIGPRSRRIRHFGTTRPACCAMRPSALLLQEPPDFLLHPSSWLRVRTPPLCLLQQPPSCSLGQPVTICPPAYGPHRSRAVHADCSASQCRLVVDLACRVGRLSMQVSGESGASEAMLGCGSLFLHSR
jgi:hypothetical protein